MDFYELNAFVVLSRNLHFAKASKELNLSPSALSRLISRLEDEVGVTLFDRTNREVALTENGKKFLEFAQNSLENQKLLLEGFSDEEDTVSGTLHVYASVTACYTIMPLFVKKLASKYPKIQLSVETGDPAEAINAIREDRAELAVAAIPNTKLGDIECIPISTSPLIFASHKNSAYTKIEGSPQDIVSSVPLILPKAGLARKRFDSWIKSRNVKPIIAAEAEGNEAVMALAALGLGIALIPQIVVENGPYRESFICHSAGNAIGYYEIGFIQKSRISGSEKTRKVRLAVTDILHSL